MKCGSKRGAWAGMPAFTDAEYEKAGAKLCDKAKEVWDGVDMMVKVKEPLPEEYGYFRKDLLRFYLSSSGGGQSSDRRYADIRHERICL